MIPFRTIVKRAFHKGMIRQDPFFDYIPERIMPKLPWLTNDEITRLMNVHTKHATWNFTQDMFIFSTFTGITFIDLENLKHTNIQTMEDGSLWIVLNARRRERLRIFHYWIFRSRFLKGTRIRNLRERMDGFSNCNTMFV